MGCHIHRCSVSFFNKERSLSVRLSVCLSVYLSLSLCLFLFLGVYTVQNTTTRVDTLQNHMIRHNWVGHGFTYCKNNNNKISALIPPDKAAIQPPSSAAPQPRPGQERPVVLCVAIRRVLDVLVPLTQQARAITRARLHLTLQTPTPTLRCQQGSSSSSQSLLDVLAGCA